jgi:hypothetical protein
VRARSAAEAARPHGVDEPGDPAGEPTSAERPIRYRGTNIPTGYFRRPGGIHVHIDGARSAEQVIELLRDLDKPGLDGSAVPGKFNSILRFSAGPQRQDRAFAETYRYHTPGSGQTEEFDSFSTMLLAGGGTLGAEALDALGRVLDFISSQPEAVVELERVIGVLELDGTWNEASPPRIADPGAVDTGHLARYKRLMTSPFEIHHSIDFPDRDPSTDGGPEPSIDDLPVWPNLGGWFLFEKGDGWSYRSSEFVGMGGDYHYAACVGQKRLEEYLSKLGRPYHLHTIVEQVLGIWRGGEQTKDDRCSVPALSAWERSCPPKEHVWVIASNFFGDRSPDVKEAMLENLAKGVSYTYFLNTHADVLRLSLLAEELEVGLVARGSSADSARQTIGENVRSVVLSPELGIDDELTRLLRSDYFLCPYDDAMGGYRLDSSGLSGERLSRENRAYLVGALNPLLETKIRGLFLSSEESWAPRSSYHAVACTDLEQSAVDQDQVPWQKMLASYDRIVAREVSLLAKKCFVVRPVRNGYLLVFEYAHDAAYWSRRLQFEVQRENQEQAAKRDRSLPIPNHNIALGYGSVTRVLRAHGYDYIGGAIDDCIALARRLRHQRIAMSRAFADQYEGHVGKREFLASTNSYREPGGRGGGDGGELRLLDWP